MSGRLLLLLTFFSYSCARNVTQGSASVLEDYSEDLSRIRPVVSWEAEKKQELTETGNEQAFMPEPAEPVNENQRIEAALQKIAAFNNEVQEAPGFRIQVFSGNNKVEFESAKSYVLQHFPELELYESYSQPTSKLKVGDFLKRIDAERYYTSLVGRFSSGKITNETISVKKSFNIN